jgi:hypothetical protein
MCENKILERETFENTLVHELVHAYDQCRVKIDWQNCLHVACAEVRNIHKFTDIDILTSIFFVKGESVCS